MEKLKEKDKNTAVYEIEGRQVEVVKRDDQTFEDVIAEAAAVSDQPSNERGLNKRVEDIEARLDAAGL